jgi:exopolyphosphatase/pppGpp-phosphohydrolase
MIDPDWTPRIIHEIQRTRIAMLYRIAGGSCEQVLGAADEVGAIILRISGTSAVLDFYATKVATSENVAGMIASYRAEIDKALDLIIARGKDCARR